MTVGEVFLSAFLQVLFDRLASRELLEVATHLNFDAELKKLALMVSKINAVLKDAEEKQVKDMAVKLWIDELRDVADDAEDALDEFATEILRSKFEAERQQRTNFMLHLFSPLNPVGAVFFNIQVASKLKSLTERLEEIARQTVELGLREAVGEKEKSRGIWGKSPTTSLVDDRVFGRVDDAKNLIESLRRDVVDDGLCVIPIVGLGGIGKTTLAQIVYNDKEVDAHFDLKAWVYVSGDFDLVRVTKAVLESLGESCFTSNLEPLQSALRKKLVMKKFLLVLDDLWNENYSEWNVLQLPFRAGARGSKIIVTTRNQTVAQTVNTAGPLFHLQQMSDDDCWLLFAQHAFSKLNSEVHLKFESIGKEIAKKCKGLPLAARVLGGLLRSKLCVDEWQHILNSEVWELPHQQCGILPELSLSYYHLPSYLKPCFAYCAIFPKGYEFDKEELVRLWIAEGLVQQREKHMQIEDVGSQYFNDLLSRSLFQRSNGNISWFIMHDLVNDLTQFAAGERCFRWEEGINQGKNWKKARHLSYIQQRRGGLLNFEEFTPHKCLRTFLPLDGGFGICQITNKAVHHLMRTFSRLHVLSLSHYEITELPDLISELKHLRYLDLSKTAIKLLPESIATLYNLQALILHGCRHLIQLPTNLGNLANLQDLDIRGTKLQQLPPNIGRLKNLHTLPYFLVSKDSGSRIAELKDLLYLRGDLCILKLEYVEKDTDAMEANLKDKQYLNKLVLEWSRDFDGTLDEDVLDALQPHSNLKELLINHYNGSKFPNWTGGPSFSNLKFVSFSKCTNCKWLPPLGQLASLKNLVIEGMDAVHSVGHEFYGAWWCSIKPFQSLETLKFKNMPIWGKWICLGVGEFPCLNELCIENCPKLSKEIPGSLASLKTLKIRNCKELSSIPCFPHIKTLVLEECDRVLLESVLDLTSLEKLYLHKVAKLKHLPCEFFNRLIALHHLEVVNCDELAILSNQIGLPDSTSLRRLTIQKCSLIFLWPEEEQQLPPVLEYLEIACCNNLIKLPHGLHSLKYLNTLKIINCPSLIALPEMDSPSNLRNLQVKDCMSLFSLPEGLTRNMKLSLEFFEVEGCPSLVSFPFGELPLTLQQLKITYCPNLNVLPAGLLLKNTCLQYLVITGCSLTSFPMTCSSILPTLSSYYSSRLNVLEVRDCNELKYLPDDLNNFLHLDKLLISNCPKLVSFPEVGLPPNLRSLSISDCENLKTLPSRMHKVMSLQHLTISNCILLESYPEGGLPTNLISICIIGCNNLSPLSKWDLYKLRSIKNFLISNQ